MKNLYDKDYFENGIESGLSCYVNYRWLPEQSIAMCESMADFMDLKKDYKILDYGCAKGFTVKALCSLGYNCYGADISSYAVDTADSEISNRISLLELDKINTWFQENKFDAIICKDVLEHIPYENMDQLLTNFRNSSNKLFIIVPLAENGVYVAPEYEKDVTHIIREDIEWWVNKLIKNGFNVEKSTYRVTGIKDNWSQYPKANAFILCE